MKPLTDEVKLQALIFKASDIEYVELLRMMPEDVRHGDNQERFAWLMRQLTTAKETEEAAVRAEEAKINELEMWGPEGRPQGTWL